MLYLHSPMPNNPEKGTFKEHQPLPYYLAATFITRDDAEQPYQLAQDIVLSPCYELELSAFRFERKPHDPSMPPLPRPWYVVVIGEQPPEPIEQQLQQVLSSGERTILSLEAVVTLAKRRSEATKKSKISEGHYAEGLLMREATIKFSRKPQGKRRRRK